MQPNSKHYRHLADDSVRADWADYLLGNHLSYLPYVGPVLSTLSTVKSWLLLLVGQVSQKPDLATIALLLVVVLVSLKILNMLLQTVTFWLRMARRLAFWGGLVGLAVWMYTRGPDGVAEDVQFWYNTWDREYQYWQNQDRMANARSRQKLPNRKASGWF